MDLATATTLQTLRALQRREISSVELLEQMAERIERFNPEVNAVVAMDFERARTEATAADDERLTDDRLGPLHGLPMLIKDTWETIDLPTTAGSPDLADHMAEADAAVVRMLRRDGAIVWGKTNTPLFAGDHQTYNDLFGLTRNPWDLDRTAGGSSGGAAAAVACGFTTAEVGSDIGGSIRQPAAFNGVFGLKTTHGLISAHGHIPGIPGSLRTPDLGVYGPIARSCGDLRLMLQTLTKSRGFRDAPNARLHIPQHETDIARLNLGLWLDDPVAPIDASMKSTIESAVSELASQGAGINGEVRPPVPSSEYYELYLSLLNAEQAIDYPDEIFEKIVANRDAGGTLGAVSKQISMSHRDWLLADRKRWQIEDDWYSIFEEVDALIAPVAPLAAFPHDTGSSYRKRKLTVNGQEQPYSNMAFWSGIATLAMLPAVCIPVGFDANNMPVGVQLIGPRFSELRLLDIAEEIVSVLGTTFTPPPLVAAG